MIRALVCLALLLPGVAAAQGAVPIRRVAFHERAGHLTLTGTFTDVFDRQMLDQLSNGFVTTVVIRVYLYRVGDEERAVGFALGEIRIAFDVWDELYVIRIRDRVGQRTYRERTRAEALIRATELAYFPVAPLAEVEIGPHYFCGVVVAVNPVSEEILAEVRRWLARPAGGSQIAGDSSFFGSFVSVFVNPRVAEADRVLRFRTQPVYRLRRPVKP